MWGRWVHAAECRDNWSRWDLFWQYLACWSSVLLATWCQAGCGTWHWLGWTAWWCFFRAIWYLLPLCTVKVQQGSTFGGCSWIQMFKVTSDKKKGKGDRIYFCTSAADLAAAGWGCASVACAELEIERQTSKSWMVTVFERWRTLGMPKLHKAAGKDCATKKWSPSRFISKYCHKMKVILSCSMAYQSDNACNQIFLGFQTGS